MNCEKVQHLIEGYKWEELPAPTRKQIQGHLESCESCRQFSESERFLQAGFAELSRLACPPEVAERIFAVTGVSRARARPAVVEKVLEFLLPVLPRPAFAAWLLLMLMIGAAYWATKRSAPTVPQTYTLAEIQQTKAQIDHAFSILFAAVKKSESLTKDKVFKEKIIQPAQQSLKIILNPAKPKGEI